MWLLKLKKSYKITTIIVLLIAPITLGIVGTIFFLTPDADVIEYVPIDIGPSIRNKELPIHGSSQQNNYISQPKTAQEGYYGIGEHLEWLVLDDYTGEVFLSSFELKAIGDCVEIWLQDDLSYEDNRETPIVTENQINYFLTEFESNIYPIDVEYFGTPDFHDGSVPQIEDVTSSYYEENGRNVILLSNIRDEMFYDDKYPYYIVGYYWGYLERQHDRNIVTIDVHDWENRVGDEASHKNLYEAVLAHEYQHLIHDDYNPYDDLFMNEGCSMYAEPLCGYPIDWSSINSFLFTPDNSLTEWGDQGDINILADYGQALLWATYLSDHYGGAEFLSYFVQAGVPGIQGLNEALFHFGYSDTFDDIFHNWRLANLLHTNQIGKGKYNYISIDLGGEEAIESRVYEIKSPIVPEKHGSDFGFTKTDLNYNTKVSLLGAYGSDYIKFTELVTSTPNGDKTFNLDFLFDGDDKATVPTWILDDQDSDGEFEWYSTAAKPESDVKLLRTINLPSDASITLTFDTYFEIEPLWDFGFVQILPEGEDNWISLENEYTTYNHDPDAYPTIVDNLPGLTGSSEDWLTMNYDLSEFAGQEAVLCFRYMTDWGTEDPGWWVDNIKINEELIDDADDLVSFMVPELPEIDFIVTLIDVDGYDVDVTYTMIATLVLDDIEESGIFDITDYVSEEGYILAIVSPNKGPCDYAFEVMRC